MEIDDVYATHQHAEDSPAEIQPAEEIPPPAVPDYLSDPNAVLKDTGVSWRYGRPPDYSKTRKTWAETKRMNHEAGSLPQLVENLVKNWEVEASFKPNLADWRTIDHANYSFAINGGAPQSAEHMLKVGTYNAIISPNEYYDPTHSDFSSSHKTFKRMMPTFAWEVLEVYSGPPVVAFRWRHWGVMKNDYVGFNNRGEKVTAKAHGGTIDIQGVTVAEVDDKVRLRSVRTWFDTMEMFRQIAPSGVVNKQIVDRKVGATPNDLLDASGGPVAPPAVAADETPKMPDSHPQVDLARGLVCPVMSTLGHARQQLEELEAVLAKPSNNGINGTTSVLTSAAPTNGVNNTHSVPTSAAPTDTIDDTHAPKAPSSEINGTSAVKASSQHLNGTNGKYAEKDVTSPPASLPTDIDAKIGPGPGEAVVIEAETQEADRTREELATVSGEERRELMNKE